MRSSPLRSGRRRAGSARRAMAARAGRGGQTPPCAADARGAVLAAGARAPSWTRYRRSSRTPSENLGVVETQYATRRRPPNDAGARAALLRRGDPVPARGLGHGVGPLLRPGGGQGFDGNPRYPDALFYLSDALYQQQNYVGARLYLRELLCSCDTPRYREALGRYLESPASSTSSADIDDYIDAGPRAAGRPAPAGLRTSTPSGSFKREDLPLEERRRRAAEAFQPLTAQGEPLPPAERSTSSACCRVQAQDYAGAMERFAELNAAKPTDDREQRIVELATSRLRRLLYETGQRTTRPSTSTRRSSARGVAHFARVALRDRLGPGEEGDFERAKNATDILLLVAPGLAAGPRGADPPGAPAAEAQALRRGHRDLQRGHQHLRAGARRDRRLLAVQKDPVAYFDNLLARNEKTLDVNTLLPPLALKWASTQEEVAEALRDRRAPRGRQAGRHREPRPSPTRILKALDERGARGVPRAAGGLPPGPTRWTTGWPRRADAGRRRGRGAGRDAHPRRAAGARAASRRASPPAGPASARCPPRSARSSARRSRMQARVDAMDREAFRLGYEIAEHARRCRRHAEVGGGHPRPAPRRSPRTRSSSPSGSMSERALAEGPGAGAGQLRAAGLADSAAWWTPPSAARTPSARRWPQASSSMRGIAVRRRAPGRPARARRSVCAHP